MDQQDMQLLRQQKQKQEQQLQRHGWTRVVAPTTLLRTHNAIRDVLEALPPPSQLSSANGKVVIPLGQGDPSIFHFLKPPQSAELALIDAIRSKKYNGYTHSAGSEDCRRAVAEFHSDGVATRLTVDDVIITVGCTQAIEFCIASLATPGSNILLPRPGFPLYETFCSYMGVKVRYYDLLPERNWEIDLDMLEVLADRNTVAIIVCNPSNPCGAAYSFDHLSKVVEALMKLAQMTVNTSTIVQAAVPSILQNTPMEFFEKSVLLLQEGANLCCKRIQSIPGLDCPSKPQGAMFIMVRINMSMFFDLRDDIGFASALATEESVIVLPGTAFGTPNWMRLIFAAPIPLLEEAWDRIEAFCKRHSYT